MNWLSEEIATNNKQLIFNRVFEKGDMPLWLRYFAFSDRRLLKAWLTQDRPVVIDDELKKKVTK